MAEDSFVDRQAETARLGGWLAPGVCVAVFGTEGIGKSRLAWELARGESQRRHVRWSRRGPLHPGSLAVFDSFDPYDPAELRALERALAAGACALTTARDVPGIPGERAFALAPLPAAPATELLAARIAARGGTPPPPAALAPLARLLDGMPLPLELAAARVADLGFDAVSSALQALFDQRASRGERIVRRDVVRLTVGWAWQALAPGPRAALARGGHRFAAAEARALREAGLLRRRWTDGAWAVPEVVRELLPGLAGGELRTPA